MEPTIKRDDWNKYIFSLFFGSGDPLENCIARAYRDFSRTLHKIGIHPKRIELTSNAKELLLKEFKEVQNVQFENQEVFDRWHHTLCDNLQESYVKGGYDKFYIGQA